MPGERTGKSPARLLVAMDDLSREMESLISRSPSAALLPFVTVAYAQSLDGCLSRYSGFPTVISNQKSLHFTHFLRGIHDGILIGKNTLNSDDPLLTVRHARLPSPRRIILSSTLELNPRSRLFHDGGENPWIGTGHLSSMEKKETLGRLGCRIFSCESEAEGLSLRDLLGQLKKAGVGSLMVEGGAGVINSFLKQNLTDLLVVTIAPVLMAGSLSTRLTPVRRITLKNPGRHSFDDDILLWGKPQA